MPTPYRGKIRISCGLPACRADRSRPDVQSACMGCPDAIREVLDLDDKVLFGYPGMAQAAEAKPAEKTPVAGRKQSKK